MKTSIYLYFQPYYFKGTASEIFKGVHGLDFRDDYINNVAKACKSNGLTPSKPYNYSFPKTVLMKLLMNRNDMDIKDACILNRVMSNVLSSGLRPLVSIKLNTVDDIGKGYNFFQSAIHLDTEMRENRGSSYNERITPLGNLYTCKLGDDVLSLIVEDVKDQYMNVTRIGNYTDNDVNEFISILSRPSTAKYGKKEDSDEKYMDINWITGKNVNQHDFDKRLNVPGESLVGVITCYPKFGQRLSISRSRLSSMKLRDELIITLYEDLIKRNKEELVNGTELEAMYLIAKRNR